MNARGLVGGALLSALTVALTGCPQSAPAAKPTPPSPAIEYAAAVEGRYLLWVGARSYNKGPAARWSYVELKADDAGTLTGEGSRPTSTGEQLLSVSEGKVNRMGVITLRFERRFFLPGEQQAPGWFEGLDDDEVDPEEVREVWEVTARRLRALPNEHQFQAPKTDLQREQDSDAEAEREEGDEKEAEELPMVLKGQAKVLRTQWGKTETHSLKFGAMPITLSQEDALDLHDRVEPPNPPDHEAETESSPPAEKNRRR